MLKGLGWVGSISIFSSGIALAQGAANELVIQPPAAQSVQSSPALPTPAVPAAPSVTPEPFVPEALQPPQPLPESADAPTVNLPSARSGSSDYDGPTSLVFSERSTGCQAVLWQGRPVPNGICPPAEPTVSSNPSAVRVSSLGLGVTKPGVGIAPAVWDYYKRTLRPTGRLGNGNIRLIFPLSIPAPISSLFGWRTHPITGEQRFHSGTDLAAPLGTPVLAAYAGQVAIADFLGGYGLAIVLDHNKNTQQTLYGHLSEIFVKPGERIKQGDVIGRVGTTGFSTGPHLHFEFRQLTPEGWVAMDAGQQLEYAMAQLVKALQVAQAR
ncbi:peptidoglycan DD-metalloendopeptidase family protein [Kovacikia minuta CCNUW1]|uniref:M23 family metallopeptidase n=1 Tax=Kovacikia minuta TaxID=2931930 RepID=UPI001CD008A0|nr:M23 family metallopeptidase [Kovacikia minuta]UBF28641.1 peptidoglycan DD-metalloendopeptidase family protein [Kovacikia minuta CCNUW1]